MPAAIDRYRILDRIGRGAMGVVYRAHDDRLGRTVAIKVMAADLESEPETRARFERGYIEQVVESYGGNMSQAAKLLGLERSHLYRKLRVLGVRER